jgi:type II restriction enzyme
MKQDFNDLINNLKKTIADYKYYTNFTKVQNYADSNRAVLQSLQALVGSTNIERDFINLINDEPKTLKIIPLLLAYRKNKVPVIDNGLIEYDFKSKTQSDSDYIKFMQETGLFEFLENQRIENLIDYYIGVEVGLDSNARKNRTGDSMESIVESFISAIPEIEYHTQKNKKFIFDTYGIDIDNYLSNDVIDEFAEKEFDFVVKTDNMLYVIETNFYSSSGSKLNETARSFKSLGVDYRDNNEVSFVWITDGVGWKTAKRNLKEAYDVLDHIYTLHDLENGLLLRLFT